MVAFLFVSLPSFCYSSKIPKIWNTSGFNSYFVGREEQLQRIHSFFKNDKKQIIAITGGPGFGKTQIAKKYTPHQ